MIEAKLKIISDGSEQSLDLFISFDNDDMDKTSQMTVRTKYRGKMIVAIGTRYPFDDAFADLQNKLPKNTQIKCCVACCHGNQCPVGNAPNEAFCTKDVRITCKSDCLYYTIDEGEQEKRSRRFWDCCDDFCPQDENKYTYSDYYYYLRNK
jgi:hypothetical protein